MADNEVNKRLRVLYGKSIAFKQVCDVFAEKERNSWRSPVERICQLTKLPRGDVVEVFKQLEGVDATPAGRIGEFIVGRRGQRSRFEWEKSSLSVARIAAGEGIDVIEERTGDAEDETEDLDAGLVTHTYRLRRDLEIQFQLPQDLTSPEATRLAKFIETLPIDDPTGRKI